MMTRSKPKVVVADDKKAANTLIAGTLQLQGFEVFQVTNALEALSKIDMMKDSLFAIYVEGNIAKERGSMIIPRIRMMNPQIKILVVVDEEEDRGRIEKLKPDFVGVLPINVIALADEVNALLIRDIGSREED